MTGKSRRVTYGAKLGGESRSEEDCHREFFKILW